MAMFEETLKDPLKVKAMAFLFHYLIETDEYEAAHIVESLAAILAGEEAPSELFPLKELRQIHMKFANGDDRVFDFDKGLLEI
jgi:hypothetical protein